MVEAEVGFFRHGLGIDLIASLEQTEGSGSPFCAGSDRDPNGGPHRYFGAFGECNFSENTEKVG